MTFREYLQKGGNPDAMRSDDEVKIVNGQVVTNKIFMPLIFVAASRGTPFLQPLLEYGAIIEPVINSVKVTPLFYAMRYPHDKAFSLLIKYGANINFKYKGITPLVFAVCLNGDYDYVEFIVNNGGDPMSKYIDGKSVLHFAAKHNRIDLLRYFLDMKLNVDSTDNKGNTPLHIAARKGNIDSVKFLVQKGAQINMKNNFGIPPVFLAFIRKREDVVKYLVNEMGAKITFLDEKHSI